MRPCGLTWHLHWPLLVSSWPSNASIWPPMASPLASLGRMHTTIERELCFVGSMWPPMASHLASLSLVLTSLKRPRSSRGASPGQLRPCGYRLGSPSSSLKTLCKSNAPGRATFGLPWPLSWPLLVPSWPSNAPMWPQIGLRPGPGNSIGMGWAAGLQGGRISSDDVLKAFTLCGFSEVHTFHGHPGGAPRECP